VNDIRSKRIITLFGSYNKNSLGDRAILISLLNLIFSEAKNSIFVRVLCFDEEAIRDEISQYEWSKSVDVTPIFSGKTTTEGVTGGSNILKRFTSFFRE
jgi:hypothetical protein